MKGVMNHVLANGQVNTEETENVIYFIRHDTIIDISKEYSSVGTQQLTSMSKQWVSE